LGECVDACAFDAMYMDPETELPVVIEDKCTACGACVAACPKDIIELRPVGKNSRRIFVSCINQDKGGTAKKACAVACTGCTLCFKECKYDAITIENFLAYIDPVKCVLCRKCVVVCPTDTIWEVNLPVRKAKPVIENKSNNIKNSEVDIVAMAKENSADETKANENKTE
jgi:Na+-translocating ferredoxin:NAD+ oxidoreductase RNF subunit RnfB